MIRRFAETLVIGGVLGACTFGSSPAFTLDSATVDASHNCPAGARDAPYNVSATIDAHNGTSNAVSITSISAVMKLDSVQGPWLQKVGETYDAGSVQFAPASIAAGSSATLNITVPSACTSKSANGPPAQGDYSITFTVTTSAGTFKVKSKGEHRIFA